MHMHAIGATEEITSVELDVDPQEENQEVQHQEVPGEGEPKVDHLLECPDHQPATLFLPPILDAGIWHKVLQMHA